MVCNKSRGIFFKRKNNVESMWEIQKGFIIRFWNENWEKKKIKHWQSSCIIHKILQLFFAVNKDGMDITTTKKHM